MRIKYLTTLLLIFIAYFANGQQSFTLEEAIEYGVKNNNSVRMKQLEIENADYIIKETKAIGMPHVDGALEYTYAFLRPKSEFADFTQASVVQTLQGYNLLDKNVPVPAPNVQEISFLQKHQFSAGVTGSWLLFDGTYLVGLRAAKLVKEIATKNVNVSRQEVSNQVAKAYLNVLFAERNLGTLNTNLKAINKTLNEVNIMYKEGFVESLDVDRLELSKDKLVTAIKNTEELIALSKDLLKFQMSYDIKEDIILSQGIDELLVRDYADLKNVELDLTKRPEWEMLQLQKRSNELQLKSIQAGYLPNLAGFVSGRYALGQKGFGGDKLVFQPTLLAGLKANIPIYDGGKKSAQKQKMKIKLQKNAIQQEEFKRGMDLQIQNAIVAIQNAKRNEARVKRTLKITENIYNKTQIKFREGVGSSIELTQAETDLYAAQDELSTAVYEVLKAKMDLELLLGNLNQLEK